jgi:(2Fe-2S) ferredoxin
MEENTAPFVCHIFVCTNDRKGVRKSCADGDNVAVRSLLKAEVKKRGWIGKVRISQCGCLGLCQDGPNAILYPQKIWFSCVSEENADAILSKVESIMANLNQ